MYQEKGKEELGYRGRMSGRGKVIYMHTSTESAVCCSLRLAP